VQVPYVVVICPPTSMSNTPSTDTDPWDRPLDVSGRTECGPLTGRLTQRNRTGERPSPHVIKALHLSQMLGTTMQRPRERKIAREYGTTRAAIFSF
jgi:hypothetical protein